MKAAAARAIAELVGEDELDADLIIPPVFDRPVPAGRLRLAYRHQPDPPRRTP